MNAAKARALNDEYIAKNQLGLPSIYSTIEMAAKNGRTSVDISLQKIASNSRTRAYETAGKELEQKGFKVSRAQYAGDVRDPQGYDVLKVSW